MQAPSIQNPMAQIQGLMSFAGDPHRAQKEDPFLMPQQGGLMAYLKTLGA